MISTFSAIDTAFKEYEMYIHSEEESKNFEGLKEKWAGYKEVHNNFIQIGSQMDIINGAGNIQREKILETINQSNAIFSDIEVNIKSLVKLNSDGAQKCK